MTHKLLKMMKMCTQTSFYLKMAFDTLARAQRYCVKNCVQAVQMLVTLTHLRPTHTHTHIRTSQVNMQHEIWMNYFSSLCCSKGGGLFI